MKRILLRSFELLFLGLLYCAVAFLCHERHERPDQPAPPVVNPPAADAPAPVPEKEKPTTIPIATDDEPILVHPKTSRAIDARPECGQEPETLTPVPSAQAPTPVEQQQYQYQCNCRRCRRGR